MLFFGGGGFGVIFFFVFVLGWGGVLLLNNLNMQKSNLLALSMFLFFYVLKTINITILAVRVYPILNYYAFSFEFQLHF